MYVLWRCYFSDFSYGRLLFCCIFIPFLLLMISMLSFCTCITCFLLIINPCLGSNSSSHGTYEKLSKLYPYWLPMLYALCRCLLNSLLLNLKEVAIALSYSGAFLATPLIIGFFSSLMCIFFPAFLNFSVQLFIAFLVLLW